MAKAPRRVYLEVVGDTFRRMFYDRAEAEKAAKEGDIPVVEYGFISTINDKVVTKLPQEELSL